MLSKTGRVCPFFFRRATSSAQCRLVAASHARQSIRSATASNHASSCVRSATAREEKNPQSNLAQDHGVYDDIAFVRAQPSDHLRVGSRLRRLAQYVGINQKGHPTSGKEMSSVVSSRAARWNQPLTGQASRSATKPSFRGRFVRLRRYWPSSILWTSNSWPGLMPSRCRIAAGKTICPLLDMVVFIKVR